MKRLWVIVSMVRMCVASGNEAAFLGQDGDSGVGAVNAAANWNGGVVPSGNCTGVLAYTKNVWSTDVWNGLALRQTGGFINGGSQFSMRGGPAGSGISTVYEIHDARTDYGSFTNFMTAGVFTMWSQHGEAVELNLLSGHVEADALILNAPGKCGLYVRDGIFHARLLLQAKGRIHFLAGGSGRVLFDEMKVGILNALEVDFASDSRGGLYVGELTDGNNARASLEWLVNEGRVSIDGVVSTSWTDYQLEVSGTATMLSLNCQRVRSRSQSLGFIF